MYYIEKHSAVQENAAGFARLDTYICIWSHNKMTSLEYVYTLGKHTSRSPNAVQVKMLPALSS